jgi:hypothetical protein
VYTLKHGCCFSNSCICDSILLREKFDWNSMVCPFMQNGWSLSYMKFDYSVSIWVEYLQIADFNVSSWVEYLQIADAAVPSRLFHSHNLERAILHSICGITYTWQFFFHWSGFVRVHLTIIIHRFELCYSNHPSRLMDGTQNSVTLCLDMPFAFWNNLKLRPYFIHLFWRTLQCKQFRLSCVQLSMSCHYNNSCGSWQTCNQIC